MQSSDGSTPPAGPSGPHHLSWLLPPLTMSPVQPSTVPSNRSRASLLVTLKTNTQNGSGWWLGRPLVHMLPSSLSLPTPESLEDIWGRGSVFWGSLSENANRRHSVLQRFSISRTYLIVGFQAVLTMWASRGRRSAWWPPRAFMAFPPSAPVQAAEQDRLMAKNGQGANSCRLHFGLGECDPGLFQGQLDSQLRQQGPSPEGRRDVFCFPPILAQRSSSRNFPLDRWSHS